LAILASAWRDLANFRFMGYTEAIANLQLLTSHASAMLESTCLVSSALSRKIPLRSLPRSRILGTDRPAARLDHFRVAL